jgi:hypothetical protein
MLLETRPVFESEQLESLPFDHSAYGNAASVLKVDKDDEAHWIALEKLLIPDAHPGARDPLRRVFSVVRSRNCESVVIEHRYVDLDFRSDYAAFWAERFEDRRSLTRRVHFFACPFTPDDLHDVSAEIKEAYLGYCVLRPTLLGPLGRTVLCPPDGMDQAVLTKIEDTPSLFGNDLKVVGVPYCQQDGEFLRCAHAAAWICHYVAWRNGVIGRRLTGEIARMPSSQGSVYRALPSRGLTGEQMQGVFSAMGLPAIYYELEDLPELSALTTPPDLRETTADEGHTAALEWLSAQRRERLLRVVCKYLNSGFPVVVLSDDDPDNHAFTVVGWRHAEERRIELIACDDQQGPYEVIEDPFADDVLGRERWWGLMLPLPQKVYLSADGAEIGAISMVITGARRAERGIGDQQDADFAAFARHLEVLDGPISIRTRLLEGRSFKAAIEGTRPAEVRRLYRLAHLPQYVWLVEFHDRERRKQDAEEQKTHQNCVIAEVVLDSTSEEQLPVADLASTLSLSKDAGEKRRGASTALSEAAGPGEPWASLITGRPTRGTGTP